MFLYWRNIIWTLIWKCTGNLEWSGIYCICSPMEVNQLFFLQVPFSLQGKKISLQDRCSIIILICIGPVFICLSSLCPKLFTYYKVNKAIKVAERLKIQSYAWESLWMQKQMSFIAELKLLRLLFKFPRLEALFLTDASVTKITSQMNFYYTSFNPSMSTYL